MYYLVDNDPDLKFDDIDSLLDYCVTTDYFMSDEDAFREWIRDNNSVDIDGNTYDPAEVFYQMDSAAYQDSWEYWAESEVENARDNARYDLRHAAPGDEIYITSYTVVVYEDVEEEDEQDCAVDETTIYELRQRLEEQKQQEEEIRQEDTRREASFMQLFDGSIDMQTL